MEVLSKYVSRYINVSNIPLKIHKNIERRQLGKNISTPSFEFTSWRCKEGYLEQDNTEQTSQLLAIYFLTFHINIFLDCLCFFVTVYI